MSTKFKRRERKPGGDPEEAKPRRRRDLSGMLNPKKGGAEPTHGGFQVLKKLREGGLDLRTKDAKMLKTFEVEVIKSLGGPESCTGMQFALLNRASELLVVLTKMSEHVIKTGVMEKNELAPCLRSSFISFSNAFRRTLESMYNMSLKKLPGPLGFGPGPGSTTINVKKNEKNGEEWRRW